MGAMAMAHGDLGGTPRRSDALVASQTEPLRSWELDWLLLTGVSGWAAVCAGSGRALHKGPLSPYTSLTRGLGGEQWFSLGRREPSSVSHQRDMAVAPGVTPGCISKDSICLLACAPCPLLSCVADSQWSNTRS